MEFKKYLRLNQPYWFCGIYKIGVYAWNDGYQRPPYYQVYKLSRTKWGNYLEPLKQHHKTPTFEECVSMAEAHHAEHPAPPERLKAALKARDRWLEV
jgi:hypothetical protein